MPPTVKWPWTSESWFLHLCHRRNDTCHSQINGGDEQGDPVESTPEGTTAREHHDSRSHSPIAILKLGVIQLLIPLFRHGLVIPTRVALNP